MKRWADLLIKKVNKDNKGRIQNVLVSIDTVDMIKGDVELTKDQVISLLKDGSKIKTIYINEDKRFSEGSTVEYYTENNGEEYLKTSSNKTAKDNLDNLPIF